MKKTQQLRRTKTIKGNYVTSLTEYLIGTANMIFHIFQIVNIGIQLIKKESIREVLFWQGT